MKKTSQFDHLKSAISIYDTGVSTEILKFIGKKSIELPKDFVSSNLKILICYKSLLHDSLNLGIVETFVTFLYIKESQTL